MSNFHVKKPAFRTVDILGLIVLVGLMTTISGAILAQAMQNDKPRRAQGVAQTLAQQIRAEQTSVRERGPGLRGPASDRPMSPVSLLTSGTIGHDPWGRPFHYFVRKEDVPLTGSQRLRGWVFVWSDGPDGRPENESSSLPQMPRGGRLALRGDDIGHVEEFFFDL